MFRHRITALAAVVLFSWVTAFAQVNHSGTVELLEFDGKTALFAVEGIAAKKGDVLQSAKETLFDRLLYTGIEGLNNDRKLMNKPREELRTKDYAVNFFKKRMHAYLKMDASGKQTSLELLGSVTQQGPHFSGVYLIPIKYNTLVRDIRNEGLLNQ